MKKKQAWIGLIISLLFLYLAFRKSDFSQIWRSAKEVEFIYLLAALPFMFISFWLRAIRWKYLLAPAGRPRAHSLFGAVMIGYMSLNLLPFRLGEFVRAYVLGRRENIPKSAVFATIIVERLFDGFTMLLFLLIALFFLPFQLAPEIMSWIRAFSYLALAIYATAMAVLVLIKVKMNWVIGIIGVFFKWSPNIRDFLVAQIHSFSEGLKAVGDARLFFIITFYSALLWIAYVLFYWVAMFGFTTEFGANLGGHCGWLGSMFVLVAIAFGIMIPSSPGFVGVFEFACIIALTALGADKPIAESYAILIHAVQFIPVTIIGIIYLYAHNFSFKEIQSGIGSQSEETLINQ